ncbi:MAG: hypothetical protein IPH09_14805 [bacterium]|nr:hypothetical protein [bacterium]
MRRHYRAAYAVALSLLDRQADAEDACQEAWLRALERLDDLGPGAGGPAPSPISRPGEHKRSEPGSSTPGSWARGVLRWSHQQLGISEVMSRQHLFQARRRLRGLLDPGEGEDRHEP